MPLDIIKDIWSYTTNNIPFLLIILALFYLFCILMEIFEEMRIPYALYLSMIPYIFIAGYGMAITKDVIKKGKRLPKILIKDVIVLGLKSSVVFIVYLSVQSLFFWFVSLLFNFPVVDVEDLLLDFFETVTLLFNHDLVNTAIFIVFDFAVFYFTMFFMEIALAKLADTGRFRDAFNLINIKKTIDVIGWRQYTKHYTIIILLLTFLSLLIDIETPFFVIDYIFKVFLGLLLFTTQYWGIGSVYRIFKMKQTANLH
ncbi:hypothetical protein TL18_04755 [Methanobrevibacter sp. YE315]|uniref:DUF4013 domain-containing protein n=1 Tax=Methanobrevibacter sp. YE315 TaxID=1609968 RepID=UPI000764ECA1|nr:DUF4013 domain-containing protein [Methanobrevibacter sp. YE315]AMD17388.1 hypothetical protein TL18_04755 [Methanobrevibacter sp. YE315]